MYGVLFFHPRCRIGAKPGVVIVVVVYVVLVELMNYAVEQSFFSFAHAM